MDTRLASVRLAGILILLTLTSAGANNCSESEVMPTQTYFPMPFPGEFNGISTTPTSSGCNNVGSEILCNSGDIVLTDGAFGDEGGSIDPTKFIAWNDSSRISIQHSDAVAAVKQVNLFFYHEPASGVGLPEFKLSASISDTDLGNPLNYTILGNQDLSQDDAQVRNVTLALTELPTESANRFHIKFTLTDSIQQFAISELQLCGDQATIEAENLTLQLDSGPVAGPAILLPANQSLTSPENVTLTCTVANQGRFQWQWTLPVSSSPASVQVSDDTRSSAIEISLGADNVALGDYTCTASYHPNTSLAPSPATGTFSVQLERILTTEDDRIDITTSPDPLQLQCTLAGYVDQLTVNENLIEWRFKGARLVTGSKYIIAVASSDCPPYGRCGLGFLTIRSLNNDDLGDYVCSFENLSQTITLFSLDTSQTTSSNANPTTTLTPPSTEPPSTTSSSNLAVVIGGAIGGVVVALLVITIIIIILVLCCRRRGHKNVALGMKGGYDDDDALYSEISKHELPPPLPARPVPGTYATIDSKDNGHIELVKMASPTRDSVISMPADMSGTATTVLHGTIQGATLTKLSAAPNNKDFPLRNNPLYSSADNLVHNAPPLPDKRFGSSPGSLEESNLNIYAVPHKPPPLPDRMAESPTLNEVSRSLEPIYSGANLTPAEFQSRPGVESPSSGSNICPYTSIYADPKPLLKEEGPIEVRPYHIKEIRPLGMGQFGEVMLAETLGLSEKNLRLSENTNKSVSIRVAVKRLKHDADKVVKEAFEKEIKFMARLNHMNVIRLIAICPTGHPFILMEYMECGDLNQYLQGYEIAPPDKTSADNQLPAASLLYMCVQISNGLRYLASLNFIHRDLATRNCLVGPDNSIKIADFGMSRSLYSSHYYRIRGRAMLPIRWMANECFYGRFSEKTDIWSFGVAMWEVFTFAKEQPYDSMSDQEVIENAVNVEDPKLLAKPEHCPPEVYDVMLQCWDKDPETRINFEDVYSSLAALHSYSDI